MALNTLAGVTCPPWGSEPCPGWSSVLQVGATLPEGQARGQGARGSGPTARPPQSGSWTGPSGPHGCVLWLQAPKEGSSSPSWARHLSSTHFLSATVCRLLCEVPGMQTELTGPAFTALVSQGMKTDTTGCRLCTSSVPDASDGLVLLTLTWARQM